MKTLLVLTLLAVAFAAAPVATATHGCVGDEDVAAVCGWHHGSYECYAFYVLGERQSGWDVC